MNFNFYTLIYTVKYVSQCETQFISNVVILNKNTMCIKNFEYRTQDYKNGSGTIIYICVVEDYPGYPIAIIYIPLSSWKSKLSIFYILYIFRTSLIFWFSTGSCPVFCVDIHVILYYM